MIPDELVVTPTIRALLKRKVSKGSFVMAPLPLLKRAALLGPNVALITVILFTAARMNPRNEFFWVHPDLEEAVGRGYRWWYEHTRALEQAGLLEIKRVAGSKPRYRLLWKEE